MNKIEVGEAVGAGFRLIRTQPGAVLLWGLVQVVAFAGLFAVVAGTMMPIVARASVAQTQGAPPDLAPMMQAQAGLLLAEVIAYAINCIVYCAVLRSVLRPEDRRFGYMRLGATEVWFILAFLVLMILFILGTIVIGVPPGIAAAAGQTHTLLLLLVVVLLVCMVYVYLRLSMAWPMIVEEGRFRLFESWRLTRGRMGSLLLTALACVAIVFLIEIIMMAAIMIVSGLTMGPAAFTPTTNPLDGLRRATPVMIAAAIFGIPALGAISAITISPFAWIYRQIGAHAPG